MTDPTMQDLCRVFSGCSVLWESEFRVVGFRTLGFKFYTLRRLLVVSDLKASWDMREEVWGISMRVQSQGLRV